MNWISDLAVHSITAAQLLHINLPHAAARVSSPVDGPTAPASMPAGAER